MNLTGLCNLDETVKAQLKTILDTCDKTNSPDTRKKVEALGVSEKEWMQFCCDELGIIDICI